MTDKATQIAELLAPTVRSLGVELLGIEYLPAPGSATLRIYIDVPAEEADATPEGAEPRSVTIDDCEAVSREVSAQLDVEDPISGNYTLEVSSPGIDRPLFALDHYRRFVGETVKVGLKLPIDGGRRRLQGGIARVDGANVVFVVDGAELTVAFDNIDKGRLVPDWAALGFAPTKGSPSNGKPAKDKPAKNKPAKGKKQTTKKPTQKPAAMKPTRAE